MVIKNNKGLMMLVISYLVIGILLILGIAFFYRSLSESKLAERAKNSIQALSIAEGGLNRAIYDLRQDFVNDTSSPSWSDGDINGIVCGPDTVNFYTLYSSTVLGNGAYVVELKNVVGENNEIWIRSTGTVGDNTKVVQTYLRVDNFNPWNNAIFAGTGQDGNAINGNVDIRGSVHILGTDLDDDDFAIDISGTGKVGNNYTGIPSELSTRIPACPTTLFGGETVQSLNSAVRIKNGLAGLSGTATIGQTDVRGNPYKETVDGVYITDGYGGNHGADNVYSDNGTQNTYDLGDIVTFPSLQSPYQGYPTYQAYVRANALVISDPAQLYQIAHIKPNSDFSYTDPNGSISMDGRGNMIVSGIVYIDGGEMNMNKHGASDTITYSGEGTILVTEEVGININLLTSGANSFPNNILGIMTPEEINFDTSNIKVAGLFYAEDKIKAKKQTSVAGAFVSNYFDIGDQVPSIYQVPDIIDNLPPGLIGSDPIWVVRIVSWQEL